MAALLAAWLSGCLAAMVRDDNGHGPKAELSGEVQDFRTWVLGRLATDAAPAPAPDVRQPRAARLHPHHRA